ncbi:MAG: ABC transporter permease [Oscillospiraceae bacterium]|jgi:peptide/nickel transport system permease protein|nr:ABC transporter permease [Oscillospiraceae bacterium]
MRRYIMTRLFMYMPTLFCVTVLVFGLMRLAPGDPAYMRLMEYGLDVTEENLAAAREDLGLDRPAWEQYALWLGRVSRLDFGRSAITGREVLPEFLAHMRATAYLSLPSLGAAVLIALPCGVFSAMYAGSLFDKASRVMTILLMSAPAFCVGLALILLFSVRLGWAPSFGYGGARHLMLPCITLAAGSAAGYTRFIRTAMLDEFSSEYVRSAGARGVPVRAIVWRGALRNAMTPIVTSFGVSLGLLLGGSAVVESVFSWPGVGKFLVDAIMKRDYAVVQCCSLAFAVFFVTLGLAADLACMALDPITRRGRGRAL